jgi:multiple sugar transport system permease protein
MKRRQLLAAYGFVLPFFLLFVSMLVIPLGYALYLSIFREKLVGGVSFVGLENYLRALGDPELLEGLARMAAFFLIQVPVMLALALLFALALDSGRLRFKSLIRLGIFLPYAIPGVVAALMWGYLYGQDFGPAAQVAESLGLPKPPFLSSGWVLGSIANIVTWSYVGYNMIIIYAALRSIPEELYDAAAVDGAGGVRIAWSIKIPAVRPALLLTAIFSVIGTFQLFNEPQLLSAVAPTTITSSFTPNMYAYSMAFRHSELNYAAAISFLLGIVIMIVSLIVQIGNQRKERRS